MVLVVISFLHGTGQSCVGEYTQSEAREFHPTLRLAGERWQDTGATRPRGLAWGPSQDAHCYSGTETQAWTIAPFKVSLTRR